MAPRTVRPAPPPYEINVPAVIGAGTLAWFVAFLVLLPFAVNDSDLGEWMWTTLAGWVLGLLGLVVLRLQGQAKVRQVRPIQPETPSSGDKSVS